MRNGANYDCAWHNGRERIQIFPWRQERRGGIVRFIPFLHSEKNIFESQVRPPEVECKAIPSGVLNAFRFLGKSAFPGFSYRTKREATKGSGVFKPLENRGGEETGGGRMQESVCTTLLREGKNERGWRERVFEPTCRGFSANATSFVPPRVCLLVSFQSFAVPNLSQGLSAIVHPIPRYRSFVSFTLK